MHGATPPASLLSRLPPFRRSPAGGSDSRLTALDRSQAVIEFAPDGTILDANRNFLEAFGCRLEDIRGRHHRLFVPADEAAGEAYAAFWERLRRGEFMVGQFRRVTPDGRDLWLQASYNPVLDANGRVARVVKFATDVTAQKQRELDATGMLAAIERSMAVIEFKLDGTVLRANENFLRVMGYRAEEVVGRPHAMFVDPETRASEEYRAFWRALAAGETRSGQFRRIDREGRDVWIEASYNPILDADGRPVKVVKYASDVTVQRNRVADFESQVRALHKVQAVIEFDLAGNILEANAHFLGAVGYTREQVVGRHHSMFVDPAYAASPAYREFWARLGRGEPHTGQYRRVARDGREMWLQASYNPILDAAGKPYKVVKFCTDITDQVRQADALKALVAQVEQFVESIAGGAGQIASGNRDLAGRTEEAASALEETAATMEEMSTALGTTAQNAEAAGALSRTMAAAARDGEQAVGRVAQTMDHIRQTSARVMEVVGVIDTIAFQTNILALNAAVEAARAGDRGRGFAVVASEVRALAQRCSGSAREIKSILTASAQAVAEGDARTREAAGAMEAVAAAVERTTRVVSDIAQATREQNEGVQQVNAAIQSLEQATQQNAALVEEASAAASSLNDVAAELHATMTAFAAKRGEDRAGAPTPAPQPTLRAVSTPLA